MRAAIFKQHRGDFSNGGLSATADEVRIVNLLDEPVDGPAVLIVTGNVPGTLKAVEAQWFEGGMNGSEWGEAYKPDMVGPMMGGCYIAASGADFAELAESLLGHRFYGAVALHDRYETPKQYASYD